ncbi:MAG: PASTA domain-containing protein [Ruminococcaceae bacterium]|nr:PASTA domain-containing protein [Oscillospiraceae bacterium]
MLDANNYLGKMLAERYRLIRVIGHGASSLVFYAEDMMVRREDGSALPVAVKVLDRDSGEYKMNSRSFRTEIQAVAGIPTSPHVVAVKDVSFHEDEHFIVMEYVSGKTLGQYLKERGGSLPAKEIISISLQLLQALRLAHEVGVVHRDIKPENIMIERADAVGKQVDIPGGSDMPFVKLADFGIALLPDEDLFAMKDKGVGTVHYISPEQASGGKVDARSDLYSLGVVMHVMATGSVPFDAGSPTGIISKHQTEMPHHVRNRNAGIPMALDDVIFTAMQKNPAARYKDALTMERRLKEVLRSLDGESVGAQADTAFRAPSFSVDEADAAQKPVKLKRSADAKKTNAPRKENGSRKLAALFGIGGGAAVLVALIVLSIVFLIPALGEKTYDITVPNLVGSIYAESNAYADGITVDPNRVTYQYDDEIEAGKVIAQTPASGVVLNDVPGVEITLTVSLGPEMADFSIPVEFRTDADTAKEYLRGMHTFLRVVAVKEAPERLPDVAPGTVVGAYRSNTAEDISLDGDKVFKNKTEEIVLYVQPEKRDRFDLKLGQIIDAQLAKEYIEEDYEYLHVVGTENAPENDPNKRTMMEGVVIGIRLKDGTMVSSFNADTQTLTVDVVVMESEIVLLLATGEDYASGLPG